MLPIKPKVLSASTELIVTPIIYRAPLKFGETEF
jgi:hypothetical protein